MHSFISLLSFILSTLLAFLPRISLAATIPAQGSIHTLERLNNSWPLLVTDSAAVGSSDDGTPDGLSILTFDATSPQYDLLPKVLHTNDVQCDPDYGVNLNRDACLNALGKIGSDPQTITVAQRGIGRRPNIVLPNRYSSCKFERTQDGAGLSWSCISCICCGHSAQFKFADFKQSQRKMRYRFDSNAGGRK